MADWQYIAGAAAVVVAVAFGIAIGLRLPWRQMLRQVPENAKQAAPQALLWGGTSLLAAGVGVAAIHFLSQIPTAQSSYLIVLFPIAAIAAGGGALLALVVLAGFIVELVSLPKGDPLETIGKQRVYDTGAWAGEEEIHAALSGRPADGPKWL
jgi:hypothetical protein